MFDRQVFQYLKGGHLLLVQQSGRTGVLGKPTAEGFEAWVEKLKPSARLVLLLPELGQLSIYLQEVPEVAWDIMEFSEKVLQVRFLMGKNLPKPLLGEDAAIDIRVESKGVFHKMLYNMGSPLMLLQLQAGIEEKELLSQFDKVLNLPDHFEWKLKPDKVLALKVNGEIRFLDE